MDADDVVILHNGRLVFLPSGWDVKQYGADDNRPPDEPIIVEG